MALTKEDLEAIDKLIKASEERQKRYMDNVMEEIISEMAQQNSEEIIDDILAVLLENEDITQGEFDNFNTGQCSDEELAKIRELITRTIEDAVPEETKEKVREGMAFPKEN